MPSVCQVPTFAFIYQWCIEFNDKSINRNSFLICYIEFHFSKHLFSLSNCMPPHIVILWYINVYMNYMHKIYCGNKRPNDCVIWWKKPCKHCILKICLSSIRSIGCKRQATHVTWHDITSISFKIEMKLVHLQSSLYSK